MTTEQTNAPETVVIERAEGTAFTLGLYRGADPSAPVFVIQPAMGMQARYYRLLAEAMRDAGLNVVVGELRGHEASAGRIPGGDYDFGYADMIDDLGDTVDVAGKAFPEAPIYLLGHSLGGQLALMYAASRPGRLAGVALVASSTVHWREYPLGFLPVSQAFAVIAQIVGYFPGKHVRFAGREARTTIRDWSRIARTGRFPVADDRLPDVDIPVLAVSIEGDTLAPHRAVDALAAKVPNAALTRERLSADGLDHNRWARRPETVVPLLLQWLDGGGAGRPGPTN